MRVDWLTYWSIWCVKSRTWISLSYHTFQICIHGNPLPKTNRQSRTLCWSKLTSVLNCTSVFVLLLGLMAKIKVIWCVASTLNFGLGCGHCFGIHSTVDLGRQVWCIVTAQGGGRCLTICTVKIAVHFAMGCCTVTAIALTSIKQKCVALGCTEPKPIHRNYTLMSVVGSHISLAQFWHTLRAIHALFYWPLLSQSFL